MDTFSKKKKSVNQMKCKPDDTSSSLLFQNNKNCKPDEAHPVYISK